MRKFFLLIIFVIVCTEGFSQIVKRTELRRDFHECANRIQTEKLSKKLDNIKSADPVFIAYKGALTASLARFSFNPLKKYSFCRSGLQDINAAIFSSPHDIELRYLRMVVEINIPSLLGLSPNIIEDKVVIMNLMKAEKDDFLKKLISDFLIRSGLCSENEKQILATV